MFRSRPRSAVSEVTWVIPALIETSIGPASVIIGEPLMEEVPAGQPSGVAERDEGDCQMRVIHVAPTTFGVGGTLISF